MSLGKLVNDYKDVSVGFLFGYLAYNEATREKNESETGLEKTLHLVSWIFLGGVAYQYVSEKKIPPETRLKFIAGGISGACHAHLIKSQGTQ